MISLQLVGERRVERVVLASKRILPQGRDTLVGGGQVPSGRCQLLVEGTQVPAEAFHLRELIVHAHGTEALRRAIVAARAGSSARRPGLESSPVSSGTATCGLNRTALPVSASASKALIGTSPSACSMAAVRLPVRSKDSSSETWRSNRYRKWG